MRVGNLAAVLFALVLSFSLHAAAFGQFSSLEAELMRTQPATKEALTSVGVVALRRPPSMIRMNVELLAKGKTLQDALTNLKDRREVVTAQLQKLKAVKDSISTTTPTTSNVQSAERRQIEMLLARKMSASGKKLPKGLNAPEAFNVTQMLTAEWTLDAKTLEDALIAAQSLKDKIKATNIFAPKDTEKLSPEEQEIMDELNEMMSNRGEMEAPQGQPSYVYVARITPDERDKALAEAFAKAKSQAEILAKAAGITLGSLTGLSAAGGSNTSFAAEEMESYSGRYSSYNNSLRRIQSIQAIEKQDERKYESFAGDPDTLIFTFQVTAIFGMGK
jgi:uncharacterized protein YggE